jgi:GTPase Era involved in 16S rRNA processing
MAVPLIVLEDGIYHVHEEGASLLQGLTSKIAVVMVCGKYRTGKSFLLNQLVGAKGSFSVGNTVESHTRGIWICVPGITSTGPDGEEIDVVFMDSEGLASTDKAR